MPSDYESIRADNIKEYGEGTRHLSFLGQLYTDRTHFIFELLQNAEDAEASKILFELFEDRLEVKHDGHPFNELDVRGVCGVCEGTKAGDLTQIGTFGIGFKSVYAYTSAPEVHSGVEHFCIKHYVRPDKATTKVPGDSWTTLFVFAFDAPDLEPQIAMYEIAKRLLNLSARTLLFLRKIKEIEYKLHNDTGGFYLRDTPVPRDQARQVTVIGQNNGQDEDETWLIFDRPLSVPDPNKPDLVKTVWVEIGFKLETNAKDQSESIVRIKDSPLVVYFPTEKSTRFGFLIQGPYKTTPSRDNIPKDDDWNTKLVEETALLLVDALQNLKEMGLLTVALLNALPIRMNDFPEDGMFYPVVEAVRDALLDQELLPADDGTFVSARNAKLASAEWLRTLLKEKQMKQLFKPENPLKWISGEITDQEATDDLWKYIRKELKVEEITPDSFARKIEGSFLENQTDDWFIAFYKYLSGQEALWRSPRGDGDAGGVLRSKPILRLQDNKQELPFRSDGMANAYLPPPEETDFPVVKREIVDNEQAADFLKRLGLKPPTLLDDIVKNVLPEYTRPDASSISQHRHEVDIQKVIRAMSSDSEADKKKVLQAAKHTPFLKAVDQNDNTSFKKPGEIYFPSEELKVYFSGNSAVCFLDETAGEKAWGELGVENKPRFNKISIDMSWEEKSRLRRDQAHTKDIETIDYDLDGLEDFLARFESEDSQLAEHSLILWNFLLDHLKAIPFYRCYDGEYKWSYYQEKSAIFDARWKTQLRNHAWLPKEGDDRPHRPCNLSPEELPDSFICYEKLADQLGMKKDEVKRIEEKTGGKFVPKEEYEEFKKWQKEKPAFPEKTSLNVDRRKEKITEKYHKAPKKKYEKKNYSKKTTENSIDPKTWLRETYTNKKGELICQICQKEMPFRKRNGDYYFEDIELLNDIDCEMEEFHIALCPLCAAMYNEFVKHDEGTMESLKNALMNSKDAEAEIPLQLGELNTSVRFVESHFQDIRTIIKAQE